VFQAHHADLLDVANGNNNRSPVVFSKVFLDPSLLAYAPDGSTRNSMHVSQQSSTPISQAHRQSSAPWLALTFFQNISGNAGAFVVRGGGSNTATQCFWLMLSQRGHFFAFPMKKKDLLFKDDSAPASVSESASIGPEREWKVTGFTPFHNINCEAGFIIATGSVCLKSILVS
jgi:hypothetical protein